MLDLLTINYFSLNKKIRYIFRYIIFNTKHEIYFFGSQHTVDVPRSFASRKIIADQRIMLGYSSRQSKASFVIGFVTKK